MSESNPPALVRLSDGLGPPLEDALKRAYYYTEAGEWRGPEVDEWDRWHAVAKVAAAQVEAERERIFAHIRSAMGYAEAGYDNVAWRLLASLVGPNVELSRHARRRSDDDR